MTNFFRIIASTALIVFLSLLSFSASAQTASCKALNECMSSCGFKSPCIKKCSSLGDQCNSSTDWKAEEREIERRVRSGTSCNEKYSTCNLNCKGSGAGLMSCLQSCSDRAQTCRDSERSQNRSRGTTSSSINNRYTPAQTSTQSVQQACDAGDSKSCTILGHNYRTGEGVTQSYETAVSFYKKGCDGGNASGCNSLAIMYYRGQGVEKNRENTFRYYQKACDGGYIRSCYGLGLLYRDGEGVSKSQSNAKALFEKACNAKYEKACTSLERLYLTKDFIELASNCQKRGGIMLDGKCAEEPSTRNNTEGSEIRNLEVPSELSRRLSTMGKARDCVETQRKYIYTRTDGVKEYQYLLTNKCNFDVVVSFCQWEQPAKDHLQCDRDNNGKASFARSTIVKANLTTDAASITGGMSAGACRESVSLNGNRYWLDSGVAGARVIKVGLSNGTSSGSYGCRYAPENNGTVTSR